MYQMAYELAVMQMAERLREAERWRMALEARQARRADRARRTGSTDPISSQRRAMSLDRSRDPLR
jgi:hypothetical protein